ncbi:MAG: hypothetical protein ABIA12_00420 [Candidatus Aenigmatarchaeota archaeon]
MIKPSDFALDAEQKRKIKKFYNLMSEGKEFYYTPFPDTLYADLNMTMTDKHLAMCMLRHLDKEIAETAEKIMKTDRPKSSKVMSIAKLVEGKTIAELIDASRDAVDEIRVPPYIARELPRLKPSRLTIWTDTPRETAAIYIRKMIDPLYNRNGEIEDIVLYATELQHDGGILTGAINSLPDEHFRHNIQHIDYLNFLKKVADRIA